MSSVFADPAQEMCSRRKTVKERQRKSRAYANRSKAAQVPKFETGNYMSQEASSWSERGSQSWTSTDGSQADKTPDLLLGRSEPLPWALQLKLALDIARGMAYLHSRGVFHRDLTSKNVLIKRHQEEDGGAPTLTAVVGDLGLAERIPVATGGCHDFRLPVVGSPYWMAPECLHGAWYDQRADVFSYGIILCEMIVRLEADPDVLPRTADFGVDRLALRRLCPDDCPPAFLRLALGCCQVEPSARPTFQSIVEQLEAMLAGDVDADSPASDATDDSIGSVQAIFGPEQACCSTANPFAHRFKDGRKILEEDSSHQ